MTLASSYRQILRASAIIGGASVLNVLIGLVRTKVAAAVLGPAGLGLIGLFTSLMNTAAAIAALGIGTAGARQMAEVASRTDRTAAAGVRRAIWWGTLILACVGTGAFWLLRTLVAERLLGDRRLASDLGWLSLGVGLTVATSAQQAILSGLQRLADLARVTVYSALIATVLGIAAVVLLRDRGVLPFLIAVPLGRVLVGQWYLARGRPAHQVPAPSGMTGHWKALVVLGGPFMLAGLVVSVGQLVVRTLVQRDLGTGAMGQFEAAWIVSMTYLGYILSAMVNDYFPRLSAAISDRAHTHRLINEQTEMTFLLAGPVVFLVIGLAPWLTHVLYSHEFTATATVLRWQVMGDILRLASWPLGFYVLASGSSRAYLSFEAIAIAVYALVVWLALPAWGLPSTGIGFVVMYAAYLPLVFAFARARSGFRWAPAVTSSVVLLFSGGATVFLVAGVHQPTGALLGVALSLAHGAHSLRTILAMRATGTTEPSRAA